MTFVEYLASKKIDQQAFESGEKELFGQWKNVFNEAGEASFTQQKLFLINPLRRKYPLKEEVSTQEKQVAKSKPAVKIPGVKKPAISKPQVSSEEKKNIAKPVIKKPAAKPVMKPKIGSSDKKSESKPTSKPVMKPKVVVPKPKKG